MELFEIIKNAPENSQLITDSIVITHAKLKQYDKILCSVSGGSDSDILVDLCQKFDDADKITYAFFDTGIEFRATKEHIAFLEQKYNIHIEHIKAVKPIPICCKTYGNHFFQNKLVNGLNDCRDMILNGKISRLIYCIKNILSVELH